MNRRAAALAALFAFAAFALAALPATALAQPPGEPAEATAAPEKAKPKAKPRRKKRQRKSRAGAKPAAAAAGHAASPAPAAAAGQAASPAAAAAGQAASPAAAAGQAAQSGAAQAVTPGGAALPATGLAAGQQPAWLVGRSPEGWGAVPSLARSVGTALRQSRAFGELAVRGGAIAHVQRGAAAFYLSWLESDQVAPDPAAAARGALDRLRESRLASSPEAGSTEELRYAEKLDGGVARAELEWRHLSNETLSLVRGFVWVTGDGKPRLAAAECVAGTSAGKPPAAVEKLCRDALSTVAVSVPPAGRGALAALPPSRVGREPVPALPGGDTARVGGVGGPSPPTVGPAASGAEGRVLYRGPPPEPKKSPVSRWLVMLGAALLLVAFYLARRTRRDEAEGDAEGEAEVEGDAEAAPASEQEKTP